jgi:hypothetical protein
MKPLFPLLTLSLSAAGALAAEPLEAALRRCRALPEAAARLGCYDALPWPASPTLPPVPPALTPEAAFGLESRRSAVQDISSSLPGLFEGWDTNTRFTLANGQVWQVSDGSSASVYLRDPKVTVRRAAMGSFRLEIAGTHQAPRVQRVD